MPRSKFHCDVKPEKGIRQKKPTGEEAFLDCTEDLKIYTLSVTEISSERFNDMFEVLPHATIMERVRRFAEGN